MELIASTAIRRLTYRASVLAAQGAHKKQRQLQNKRSRRAQIDVIHQGGCGGSPPHKAHSHNLHTCAQYLCHYCCSIQDVFFFSLVLSFLFLRSQKKKRKNSRPRHYHTAPHAMAACSMHTQSASKTHTTLAYSRVSAAPRLTPRGAWGQLPHKGTPARQALAIAYGGVQVQSFVTTFVSLPPLGNYNAL